MPNPSALPHVVSSPQQHFAYIFVLLLLLHCPEKLKGLQEEEEKEEEAEEGAAEAKTGEDRSCDYGASRYDERKIFGFFYSSPLVRIWI